MYHHRARIFHVPGVDHLPGGFDLRMYRWKSALACLTTASQIRSTCHSPTSFFSTDEPHLNISIPFYFIHFIAFYLFQDMLLSLTFNSQFTITGTQHIHTKHMFSCYTSVSVLQAHKTTTLLSANG